MHLVFMSALLDNYNDKARNYNTAWLNGASKDLLWECEKDLIMSTWDYLDARKAMLGMLGRLGPPLPLERNYQPSRKERAVNRLRQRFRTARQRQPSPAQSPAATADDTTPEREPTASEPQP